MAKRLLGSVRGDVKKRVTKLVLPVAAKLAEGAVAALDAADRLMEKQLSKGKVEPKRAVAKEPAVKRDGAGAPLREGAAPKRIARAPRPEIGGKTRPRPAVAAKRVTAKVPAKKVPSSPGGLKPKRGQKHRHHR